MDIKRDGSVIKVEIEGSLGETSIFFTMPIKDTTEIVVNMEKMTYMNSVGVKNWIVWTMKIPRNCTVRLLNAPVLIAAQGSTIQGFMTPNIMLESVRIPYACDECGFEKFELAHVNKEYFYKTPTHSAKIALAPKLMCPKCNAETLELDIIPEKTFRFLNTR